MKKRKRLLCLGVAISILCTNMVFGEEYIPPNPLTGTTSGITGGFNPGPGYPGTWPGDPAGMVSGQQPGSGTAQTPEMEAGQPGNETGQPREGTENQAGETVLTLPAVEAEGAVLLDCSTGQILFEKNAHNQFFPASITKVMTALLTIENCNLNDIVTFSERATTNLESGAVTLNLTAGDQLTVEQCLYALLLKSANEVANGLAEHMAGSTEAFAQQMNARAAQLGCTGTNFVNPNGLNNDAHVTTPYDMALIARAAYANPVLSKISTTTSYQMPATLKSQAKVITMGHKMNYPTDSRYYPGMVGGKTGYTSKAKNTLVTCVEKDGVRLVAVVMKAGGTHYTDTRAMLDYGFALAASGGTGAGSNEAVSDQTAQECPVIPAPGSEIRTGWQQTGDSWYYIEVSGDVITSNWVKSGENWYYLGEDGSMLTNTTTPDGYYVGPDGAWQP